MNLGVISLGLVMAADPAIKAGSRSIKEIKKGKFQGPTIPTTSKGLY